MSENIQSHSRRNMQEWLSYIESIHSIEIDMGLARISEVANRLNIDFKKAKVITVAGTNGKGTTCAFIENALLKSKHSVAVYSSPHINRFNERLRVNKSDVEDHAFVDAFEQVEQARDEISLTYYEFTTLAAFVVLMSDLPDYIILEVGLGGRLDATNIIDADMAVLTTVDLDHQAFLGNTREAIGREKAGIFRKDKIAVIGDANPPATVVEYANEIGANTVYRNTDFSIQSSANGWSVTSGNEQWGALPKPSIPKDNIATALQALSLLSISLPEEDVVSLIKETKVPGRTEWLDTVPATLMDVGHNPLAARYLASVLSEHRQGKIKAVVGMLADKDIENTLKPLKAVVDTWYLADLNVPRGATAKTLAGYLVEKDTIYCFDNVEDAYKMATTQSHQQDTILVFGSFFTVAEVKQLLG